MKRRREPTFVDLFSGAGGLSLGFRAAGARSLAAVDASESAGETYRRNFSVLQPSCPPAVLCGDEGNVEDLDFARIAPANRGPDILVGGPPCQGFSRIGRAKLASLVGDPDAGDPRNDLYRRFLDAARFWRPRALVMENVPGMLSLRGTNVADAIASDLASEGYRVGYALLNAARFGVPQFRERLFFIGIRDDGPGAPLPSVPPATHLVDLPSGYLRAPEALTLPLPFVPHFELEVGVRDARLHATTVEEALGDLPRITDHLSDEPEARRTGFRRSRAYEQPPASAYARLMRAWPGLPVPTGVDDHVIRRTPRDFETFRRMRPADRYPEALAIAEARFSEELESRRLHGEAPEAGTPAWDELRRSFVPPYPVEKFVDKWRKLDPSAPSWTVPAHLAKDAYSHIHYDGEQARAISVREAARLQSFPDAFEFTGNMGDCFQQIGNAVPPLLAWQLAGHLMACLGWKPVPCSLAGVAPSSFERHQRSRPRRRS